MRYIVSREQILELSSYHRGIAEDFEKLLTNYLNNPNSRVPQNIKFVGDKIKDKFPNIIEAQHIGSHAYNIEGDILLITKDKAINLELKTSDTFGRGTLANVSQKLFQAINPEIIGYQEFHNNYVYNDITFREYCWKSVGDNFGVKIKTSAEYQRYLRTLRDAHSEIVDNIVNITNEIKIEYNEYLVNELKSTKDYLYRLTYLVRLLKDGIHTYSEIKKSLDEFKSSEQYISRSKYYVLYVYNVSSNISCQIVDYNKALDTVVDIEANGQSIILKNKDGQTVLRFSTHWKNICQGGATPCFNVFHGAVDISTLSL